MERKCDNCEHWDSRDGLMGECEELTATLRIDNSVEAVGLLTVQTKAWGTCRLFSASSTALTDEAAEAAHITDMHRAAGRDYPASL